MSVQSAPYFWLVCDHPGCTRKSTDTSEFTAWADQGGAEEEAMNSDWQVGHKGNDFCWEHVKLEEGYDA